MADRVMEYGVMMKGHPEELHRGPMTEAEARDWVATWRHDGGPAHVFMVVCRWVDPWRGAEVERPCDCGKQIYDDPAISHCYYHHEDETIGPDGIVCGECFHVYNGPDDLLAAETERWGAPREGIVMACPYCIHDL
jgi:hypothetical protein